MASIGSLFDLYSERKEKIRKRIGEFEEGIEYSEERIFAELCFCLCTPQCKAVTCWKIISTLAENGLLYTGSEDEIARHLCVRFRNVRARHIVEARRFLSQDGRLKTRDKLKAFDDILVLREWLVRNIKGFGMKEASHFLRNTGLGLELAILDRHILKNLKRFGVIEEVPASLSRRSYEQIENRMKIFSDRIGIPMAELDLLLWSLETGMIFK
ncbi:MAG: N-glycosylase/DNA lyase [Candidatus Bathyarchaeia archaeon]